MRSIAGIISILKRRRSTIRRILSIHLIVSVYSARKPGVPPLFPVHHPHSMISTIRGCCIIVPKSKNKHRTHVVSANDKNKQTKSRQFLSLANVQSEQGISYQLYKLSTRPANLEAQVSRIRRSVAIKIKETNTTYRSVRINRGIKVIMIILYSC